MLRFFADVNASSGITQILAYKWRNREEKKTCPVDLSTMFTRFSWFFFPYLPFRSFYWRM